jgi:oligopeptide transport system ATP-binding protein
VDSIFYRPSHPYTAGLLAAVPRLDGPDTPMLAIPGAPPNMAHLPAGCPFSGRCALVQSQCADVRPVFGPAVHDANVLRACHLDAQAVSSGLQRLLDEAAKHLSNTATGATA